MAVLSVPDLIITIAYFSIPLQIVVSLWQYPRVTQSIASAPVVILVILFALFIFLCGAGHLLRCLGRADTAFFHGINIVTAAVSLVTALYLVPFTPGLLARADEMYVDVAKSKKIIDAMYPPHVRERLLRMGAGRPGGGKSDGSKAGPEGNSGGGDDDGSGGNNGGSQRSRHSHGHSCHSNDHSGGGSPSGGRCRSILRRLSDEWANPDSPPVRRIQDFLRLRRRSSNGSQPDFDVAHNIDSAGHQLAEPIAETFPAASILFADISSFTQWSSTHSPNDVFTLLESLFWEFDELAEELGVFKLGTVGDCYIAAAGVPYPRDDHAVILAEFAERCRRRGNEVRERLSAELGMDGMEGLDVRFGMHSGPVTAGVLRGQKSRFELFGDTINTASRMESTGVPGRIQVSMETAELIRRAGRGEWVIPREGTVVAKGKGELRTCWLEATGLEDKVAFAVVEPAPVPALCGNVTCGERSTGLMATTANNNGCAVDAMESIHEDHEHIGLDLGSMV